ncbi:hypothetical protein [Sorangium sp. So ce542]|uniref:hypothetical protein n=1 Tax=Sorangium sp. So ce542 TaxID=3133316 RepID=UPI003F616459
MESAKRAFDEATKRDPEQAEGCAFVYAFSLMAIRELAEGHGAPCTTAEECPNIECPVAERGGQACLAGKCGTEEDLCE